MTAKNRRTLPFDIINTSILVIVALVCIVPFLYIFFISISDGLYLSSGEVTFFPKGVNLEAYKEVITNPRFNIGTGFRNSAIYTVLGTIIAVVFTYLTAYVLTRPRVKFRFAIMTLFVITWVFEAGIIPQYIAYSSLGIGRLIYQLPIPLCKMFIREIFEGKSPDDFDEETLTTINKFFENNLNVSETSRQLYIHRNTLVYRLDKLQKSTGLDLRVFEDAITFKIALMVVKYMKYMESLEY